MNYRELLLTMVREVASGKLSVQDFMTRYYDSYVEEVPEDGLSETDYEFFGKLHEKLDWTAVSPSDEERLWGWINFDDYREWAAKQLAEYLRRRSSAERGSD